MGFVILLIINIAESRSYFLQSMVKIHEHRIHKPVP